MTDFVGTLIMATQNSYLCHKVHVVLHYLDSVLIWTPCAIFSPLSHSELDTGEALPGEGVPHQRSLQQIGESVKWVAEIRVKLARLLLQLVAGAARRRGTLTLVRPEHADFYRCFWHSNLFNNEETHIWVIHAALKSRFARHLQFRDQLLYHRTCKLKFKSIEFFILHQKDKVL